MYKVWQKQLSIMEKHNKSQTFESYLMYAETNSHWRQVTSTNCPRFFLYKRIVVIIPQITKLLRSQSVLCKKKKGPEKESESTPLPTKRTPATGYATTGFKYSRARGNLSIRKVNWVPANKPRHRFSLKNNLYQENMNTLHILLPQLTDGHCSKLHRR